MPTTAVMQRYVRRAIEPLPMSRPSFAKFREFLKLNGGQEVFVLPDVLSAKYFAKRLCSMIEHLDLIRIHICRVDNVVTVRLNSDHFLHPSVR